jgi:hypothetical protein
LAIQQAVGRTAFGCAGQGGGALVAVMLSELLFDLPQLQLQALPPTMAAI